MLCSTLENPESKTLKPPETALLEWIKARGGEVTDRFLVNFVEHQISRIEVSIFIHLNIGWAITDRTTLQTCISTLAIRNMIRPFKNGLLNQACPMTDVLSEVASSLEELKVLKESADFEMAPS